ncbi:Oligopeptide transport ATP-binding protein OppF [compost metagenome]
MYTNPLHPYTKSLLAAIPVPDPAIEKKKTFTVPTEAAKADPYSLEHSRFVEAHPGHWVAEASGE